MAVVRIALAAVSVVALLTLGAVVAIAAPNALGRAASPKAGAAAREYCPPVEKTRRQNDWTYAQGRATAERKAYFAKHPKAHDRTAFVHAQQAHLKALQQAFAHCS